jgi:magnesium transporter
MRSLFSRGTEHQDQPAQLHASDMARILDAMEREEALPAFTALGDLQIEVFPYLSVELQRDLIDQLPKARVSAILNALSSDDRTALFYSFEDEELPQYLAFLNPENESTTNDLLEYPENSVAMLVDTGYATVQQDMTVSEAVAHLRKHLKDNEAADVFFIVDDNGILVDDMPMRRLVLCDPEKTMRELMDGFYVTLQLTDTKEDAIARFKEYDRVVLPVVDEQNKMRGVVTIDDVLDAAEEQDTREMQQFGGVESLDYPYTETALSSLIRKRAGWLIILFFSEMLTASAMGYFAGEIEKAYVLALFVPLIISSGGNSGSQAATLIIRAMALKEVSVRDWWYVMRREIISGLVLGLLLGTIGFIRIAVWQKLQWYDYGAYWLPLALTVAFSLIGIVLWGTLSGSMIPLILKKCRLDPATSSAPFVATLVDVTGLIIYFSIAALILSGTLL